MLRAYPAATAARDAQQWLLRLVAAVADLHWQQLLLSWWRLLAVNAGGGRQLSSIAADQLKTSLQQINLFFWHCICVEMMCSAVKYMGGKARTFQLDVDELYFEKGLRRVYSDDEVRVMSDVMVKFKCISCYVAAAVNAQSMVVVLRPLSPFTPFETFADLQAEQFEAENYEAQNDENADGEGPIYGSTVTRSEKGKSQEETEVDTVEDEFVSDYDESGDELNIESEGEDNEVGKRRKKTKCLVVNSSIDFSNLKWVVGIRFPNKEEFKEYETRYVVAHGRNLTWVMSDKGRQQRLEVKCNPGCPFRLYCSWDSRSDAFVVKSVEDQHTCVRNMESNRQLKSTWLAKQFLELFKSRPHWPAKEIAETIRVAYRVLVKVGFAYKVKYYAHRLLHGSMKEHYSKLGRYLEALKESSPNSYFKLEVDNSTHPATFDKVFFCFDGVKQGWLKGCRKVLCLDGCFLKTYLGGMLLSAIGSDANEQMYPLAWAVVEGETNASWQWFLLHLKKVVREEDGHGWTIFSDENPVQQKNQHLREEEEGQVKEVEEAEVEAAMVEAEVELQLEIEEEVGVEEGEEVGVEEEVEELQQALVFCSVQTELHTPIWETDSKALQANTSVYSKTPQASTSKH
ncbi:hypothetical protein RDABS01_026172 [Bienertia sinuspersici]